MADGHYFENRKLRNSAAHCPIFTKFWHGDVDVGANLNFSEKLRKYENPRWRTASILKIENTQ